MSKTTDEFGWKKITGGITGKEPEYELVLFNTTYKHPLISFFRLLLRGLTLDRLGWKASKAYAFWLVKNGKGYKKCEVVKVNDKTFWVRHAGRIVKRNYKRDLLPAYVG